MNSSLCLDGLSLGKKLRLELKSLVDKLDKKPGLAVIIVGNNPASLAYIGMKKKACDALGFFSKEIRIDPSEGQKKLESVIDDLNADTAIHGILLQLPLPPGFNELELLKRIDSRKDVDGFHPINVGKVLSDNGGLKPCTPYGVMELLNAYNLSTEGKHVVILGRSNIVGKPMAALMLQRQANATVTVCHSRTKNLTELTQQADILVAALGKPKFVTSEMVKDGAIVVDVGINRVQDKSTPKGYCLVGDVDYDSVMPKAKAITPVPGGVGPMTIAMLMMNTYEAYCHLEGLSIST